MDNTKKIVYAILAAAMVGAGVYYDVISLDFISTLFQVTK